MMGLCLILLAKEDEIKNLGKPVNDEIRFGFNGVLGNKGGLMLHIVFGNTPLCFFNCHLSHGDKDLLERVEQLQKLRQFTVKAEGKEIPLMQQPRLFIVGDLNFRLSLSNEECRKLIEEKNLKELLKHDELWMSCKEEVEGLKEEEITFMPTYKYNEGTSDYDTSEKNRAPAWCDRILWKQSEEITCRAYSSCMQISSSDHKPLYGIYGVKITQLNNEAKEKVKESVVMSIFQERTNSTTDASIKEKNGSEKFLVKSETAL
eukprot:TRINITY_DN3144_c0_g4_i1.p2 TRINITY_DN3144_c0_g4~~TRINITY_DN3144_c0_g4_i1.p2  ORF type:complete len:261 (+),score=86.73 TRINITY_DN3144_c0_g4_i1:1169-1951(+)